MACSSSSTDVFASNWRWRKDSGHSGLDWGMGLARTSVFVLGQAQSLSCPSSLKTGPNLDLEWLRPPDLELGRGSERGVNTVGKVLEQCWHDLEPLLCN
jgi:hypothetical protein